MKKSFLLIFSLLSIGASIAQVGINTRTPQGILHIDGKGNTLGNANVADDVIVTSDGKMGLGTNIPTTSVDVRGSLRYVDGNQAANYMLQSDAVGNAKWVPQGVRQIVPANQATDINGVLHGYMTGMTITAPVHIMQYMNVSITLPPGGWQVSFNGTFATSLTVAQNIWWDLCTSATSNISSTRVGRVLSSPVGGGVAVTWAGAYAPVTAVYFVSHTVTTTYYMWAGTNNLSPDWVYSGEGRMWAMPVYN